MCMQMRVHKMLLYVLVIYYSGYRVALVTLGHNSVKGTANNNRFLEEFAVYFLSTGFRRVSEGGFGVEDPTQRCRGNFPACIFPARDLAVRRPVSAPRDDLVEKAPFSVLANEDRSRDLWHT